LKHDFAYLQLAELSRVLIEVVLSLRWTLDPCQSQCRDAYGAGMTNNGLGGVYTNISIFSRRLPHSVDRDDRRIVLPSAQGGVKRKTSRSRTRDKRAVEIRKVARGAFEPTSRACARTRAGEKSC